MKIWVFDAETWPDAILNGSDRHGGGYAYYHSEGSAYADRGDGYGSGWGAWRPGARHALRLGAGGERWKSGTLTPSPKSYGTLGAMALVTGPGRLKAMGMVAATATSLPMAATGTGERTTAVTRMGFCSKAWGVATGAVGRKER